MAAHDWLDPDLYPFESRFAETPHGRMHYVDEGSGPVVLMVHGTPTWSFLFRGLIRDLSRDHRVVAIDHLGFGLSDKPADAPYRPEDHAARLSGVIEWLLLWGMRDRFFGPEFLGRWADAFPDAEAAEFTEAGHFVPEEVYTNTLAESIRRHVARSGPTAPASPGESLQPVQGGTK